jgi:hypothetical protein
VQGPDKFVYYDVEGVMVWLQERNLYRRPHFYEPGEIFYEGPVLNVTKRVMMAW